MGKFFICCATAIVFSASIAYAADWRLYSANDVYKYFYDAAGIKRTGHNIFKVRAKEVAGSNMTKVLTEINCSTKEIRVHSITIFDVATNKTIASYKYDSPPWDFIHPEPEGESLIKAICKK
ncbi:MAG: hypothetical protein EPN22_14130 [Nitrospirae bacterium]|nr:MAG: hypothetical protein EPN22_14130 [Nitrospirota bacterium]